MIRTTEAKKAKKGIGVTTSEVDHNICAKRASTFRPARRSSESGTLCLSFKRPRIETHTVTESCELRSGGPR